jgi:hypothetical protein
MMSLFDPAAHESLTRSRWDETRARLMIAQITTRAVDAYQGGRCWPRHALDRYDGPSDRDKGL